MDPGSARASIGKVVPPPGDPLRLLRWLAVLGVAALIVGRFVAPAVPGALVGMSRLVRAVELSGGVLSQLFAVTSMVGLSSALVHTATSTIPSWMRLVAMAVGSYAALVVLGGAATTDRVPGTPALIAAAGAGVFAIIAALASRASRVVRLPALALALVGVAAIVRAVRGLAYVHASAALAPATLLAIGRTAATVSAILIALAALLGLVYIGRSSRPEAQGNAPDRASLWSPVTLLVLVLAVVCARQAAAGATLDAGTWSVLLKRASDRFLLQPEPHLRGPFRLFLGFLTPLTAAGLLAARRVPTLGAALCLVLVAADVVDAPLGALTLTLASLGILLVARSGHVLWSALVTKPLPPPSSGAPSSPL